MTQVPKDLRPFALGAEAPKCTGGKHASGEQGRARGPGQCLEGEGRLAGRIWARAKQKRYRGAVALKVCTVPDTSKAETLQRSCGGGGLHSV